MADVERRRLQEEADRVERETGYRVGLPDYGSGPCLILAHCGFSDQMTAREIRLVLDGFRIGVEAERRRTDG